MAQQDTTNSDNPMLKVFAITILADDLDASVAWYKKAFGAPVANQDDDACAFRFSNIIINVLLASEGADLVKPRQIGGRDAGKRFQITVNITDLDAHLETLKDKGVEILNGPEVKPWGIRCFTMEDPGGHVWEIAESTSK